MAKRTSTRARRPLAFSPRRRLGRQTTWRQSSSRARGTTTASTFGPSAALPLKCSSVLWGHGTAHAWRRCRGGGIAHVRRTVRMGGARTHAPAGYPPFAAETPEEVFDNVRHFHERLERPISDDGDEDAFAIPDDAWDLISRYASRARQAAAVQTLQLLTLVGECCSARCHTAVAQAPDGRTSPAWRTAPWRASAPDACVSAGPALARPAWRQRTVVCAAPRGRNHPAMRAYIGLR